MYATMRSYAGAQGLADEIVRRQDEIKSIINEIQGFRAYYLISTDDGSTVSVGVFDDQAGAEESTRRAREWLQANLPDMAGTPPQVSSGEVVVQF